MHRVARCADGAGTPLSPTPRGRSTWHSGYRRRGGFPAVAGRRVRQRLTPTTRRRSRRPRREGVLPRMHCPNPVGATRCVARRAKGPGMDDDVRGRLCMAQRPSTSPGNGRPARKGGQAALERSDTAMDRPITAGRCLARDEPSPALATQRVARAPLTRAAAWRPLSRTVQERLPRGAGSRLRLGERLGLLFAGSGCSGAHPC